MTIGPSMNSTNRPVVPVDCAVVRLSPLIKGGTTGTTTLHPLSHGKRNNRGQPGTTKTLSPYNACSVPGDNQTQKGAFRGDEKLCKKRRLFRGVGTTQIEVKPARETPPPDSLVLSKATGSTGLIVHVSSLITAILTGFLTP